MAINYQQKLFAEEYCVDLDSTQAAIRAGYPESRAHKFGLNLLENPGVKEHIKIVKKRIMSKREVNASWVLDQWLDIATADPNQLMQLRRVCCRYCYGENHKYQWTQPEYMRAVAKAYAEKQDAPMAEGGFGFNGGSDPNLECPECFGRGEELVHMADTRKLTGSAKKLYAGVKQTRQGVEIQTRDQDAALLNIAKYVGMLVDRKEHSTPPGHPLAIVHLAPKDCTDEQLLRLIALNDDKPEGSGE